MAERVEDPSDGRRHLDESYAARLLERQDALQTKADQLFESLDLPAMLGRAGRLERFGRHV